MCIVTVGVQECLPRSVRRLSHGRKGFYSSSRGLRKSGLKLNSDISKESSSLSILKPVPRLSDETAWAEENQQNELTFGACRIEGAGAQGSKWAERALLALPQLRIAAKRNSHWTGARGTSQLNQRNQWTLCFPSANEGNGMVRRHMPCPESQIPGAEKAKRNAASKGTISHPEDARARPWVTKGMGMLLLSSQAVRPNMFVWGVDNE